jgi:adhesin transport system membrane fusion protein
MTRGVELSSLRLAKTPRLARRLSRSLLAFFVLLPIGLIFVPWTQSVHGTGKAIAFNPVQRPQFLVSPIEGRIKKWYVMEGQRVSAGQLIVEMVDNDPNLELRLLDEERAILDRLRAAEGRVLDIGARIRNLEGSRELAIAIQGNILRQEQARVQGVEQELIESKAILDAAEPHYRRQKELFENKLGGLASQRDLELAIQALETAQAKYRASQAKVKLAKAAEQAARESLGKVDADTNAMINLETATRRAAEAEVAGVRRDKAQIEVRIARQRAQNVYSPCNGVIFRLLANAEQGGSLVRPGERLAVLVPDILGKSAHDFDACEITGAVGAAMTTSPLANLHIMAWHSYLTDDSTPGIVAELLIDGNDFPIVREGDKVRLQFEGWPAVQFVGWPSVAVGTFGGKVRLIDPTSNDKGQFRILVEPDPDDAPWPDERYLRQGVRAQGWVLLRSVSTGWELWRQLNGFPPVREFTDTKTKVKKAKT